MAGSLVAGRRSRMRRTAAPGKLGMTQDFPGPICSSTCLQGRADRQSAQVLVHGIEESSGYQCAQVSNC